jgi:hypothetical protein
MGGLIDSYLTTEDLLALDLQVAADATTALLAVFEGLTTEQKKRFIIYLEVLTVVWTAYENNVLSGNWGAISPVAKINIPAKDLDSQNQTQMTGCALGQNH